MENFTRLNIYQRWQFSCDFLISTLYLQDDPLTPEMCDFDESGVPATADDTSPVCFTDLGIDDTVYTATTINLHDLE